MTSLEMNGKVITVQDIFFSKENISGINKKILEKNNFHDIPKEGKKQIIDLIIKNMKSVYKSIDLRKINKKNLESIFDQFNKVSLAEVEKELKKKDILSLIQPNASDLKFKRDFDSNPNGGNKIMERPTSSTSSFLLPPNFASEKNISNNKFDKLFKPIVDSIDDNYSFNQYQYGKGSDDIQKRMDGLISERDTETMMPGRPKTPEFLKPIKTKQESMNDKKNNNNDSNFPSKRTGRPDFSKEIPQNELNNFKSINEDDAELYNINNIDKPIDIKEIREDSRSFSDRLKSLQNDRGSVNIPQNRGKVDFTSDNFQNTFNSNEVTSQRDQELEEIPDYEPKTVEQIRKEKEDAFIAKKMAINNTVDEDALRMQNLQLPQKFQQSITMQQMHQFQQMKQNESPQLQKLKEMEEESLKQQLRQLQQLKQLKQLEELKQLKQLKQLNQLNQSQGQGQGQGQSQSQSQNQNQNQNQIQINRPEISKLLSANKNIDVKKIQETLKKLGMVEYSKVENLINENNLLKLQIRDLSSKEPKATESNIDIEKLKEKEKLLLKKEEELKGLIKNYNYVYGTTNVQLDISPSESKSVFNFTCNSIEHVIGIKLMSYSIPQARYNIEDGKNNLFKGKIENDIFEIKVPSGKYNIQELIKGLNKNEKIKFNLNLEEKIEISSDNTFDILSTPLSKEVLGFTNSYIGQESYVADRIWDLRIEEKAYLFLNNIDDTTPFALLYPNNQGNYQIKFEQPTTIDNLELVFKDSKGRLFNFNGLNYSINIQLEIINPEEILN